MARETYTVKAALADAVALQLRTSTKELHDFAHDDRGDWSVPLELYVQDLNDSPHLTNLEARQAVYKLLCRSLAYRLQIIDLLKQHSNAIDATPVPPIIMVASFPRSGSTLLHNLLFIGQGEGRARALLKWESILPSPLAAEGCYRTDPRVQAVSRALHKPTETNVGKALASMHFVDADDPEETNFFSYDLWGVGGMALFSLLPRWGKYVREPANAQQAFVNQRRLIKLFCLYNPPAQGAALVLKSPGETMHIDIFANVFPEAKIVLLHRDPYRVVDSGIEMGSLIQEAFHLPNPSASQGHADFMLALLDQTADGMLEFSRRRGPGQIINVHYESLLKDPASEAMMVLHMCGFSSDAKAMLAFLDAQKKGKRFEPPTKLFSKHQLTMAEVHERFAQYIAHFDVPVEHKRRIIDEAPPVNRLKANL